MLFMVCLVELGVCWLFGLIHLMISTILDYEDNGTYAIALFIANVIAIPTNALNQITAPNTFGSFSG